MMAAELKMLQWVFGPTHCRQSDKPVQACVWCVLFWTLRSSKSSYTCCINDCSTASPGRTIVRNAIVLYQAGMASVLPILTITIYPEDILHDELATTNTWAHFTWQGHLQARPRLQHQHSRLVGSNVRLYKRCDPDWCATSWVKDREPIGGKRKPIGNKGFAWSLCFRHRLQLQWVSALLLIPHQTLQP